MCKKGPLGAKRNILQFLIGIINAHRHTETVMDLSFGIPNTAPFQKSHTFCMENVNFKEM